MGKTFVIMECRAFHNFPERGYVPTDDHGRDDETWIDPRHVIEGERLRNGIPNGETAFHCGPCLGWREETHSYDSMLILDPPKPTWDEWETWANDCPLSFTRQDRLDLGDWLRKMPRKP